MTQPNPSTAQARAIADELARQGVRHAIISPGSRSAALAIALDQHPAISTRVVLDERSAAFRALGIARATGAPAVAVATSGTATANLLPAVVEADRSMVSLVLLTADRPPELLDVGANQTIDQVEIFGDRVRWFCAIPPAEPGRDQNPYWRSAVSQAIARASGAGGRPGPVHLNVSFREPTVPVTDDGRTPAAPYSFSIEGRSGGRPWQEPRLAQPGPAILDAGGDLVDGLVIAGDGDYDPVRLREAADGLSWPVLATAISGARLSGSVTTYHHLLVDGGPPSLAPEMVLVVGKPGPSDKLLTFAPDAERVVVDRWGDWWDPTRAATRFLQADPVATLEALRGRVTAREGWSEAWQRSDAAMRSALDDVIGGAGMTGPAIARALSALEWSRLVVGSSLPIRDVDAHTVAPGRILANRGASGIDGVVSTAMGVADAEGPVVALLGDLSFLHDSAGLVSDSLPDIVFVVVDNGGGGLFDILPQSSHAPGYERLFVSPHHLDIVELAKAHGLDGARIGAVDDLTAEVGDRLAVGGPHVLVAPVDRGADLKVRALLDETARRVASEVS